MKELVAYHLAYFCLKPRNGSDTSTLNLGNLLFDTVTKKLKSIITTITNSEENSKRKDLNERQNQMIKHIKRMDNNCHFPDLEKVFSKTYA